MPADSDGLVSRREALLLALAAVPLIGCRGGTSGWPAGTADGLPAGTWIEREMVFDADAGELGHLPVFLRRDAGGGAVRALSGHCTCDLEGPCPVRWIETSRRFVCPCHGTVYDERGAVVGGPARRPLEPRQARVEDGRVYIAPRP